MSFPRELDVTDGSAALADRMVVRLDVGVEAAGPAHVQLATMPNRTQRAQGVIDGRHRHCRKPGTQALVQLLRSGVGFVVRNALDDGETLRGET